MISVKVSVVVLLCCIFNQSKPMNIGSDTNVTRFNAQQNVFNGDRVANFAALAGGFYFFGSLVTAQWDTFFGASGLIDINNGTLTLNRDLIFQDNAIFATIGNIVGNGFSMELAPTMSVIQTSAILPGSCLVSQLGPTLTASRNVESLSISNDDEYVVIGFGFCSVNCGVTYPALGIYSISPISGLALLATMDIGTANDTIATEVAWRPNTATGTYQFAYTNGNDTGTGPGQLYMFSWTPPSTLTEINLTAFTPNVTGCAWNPSGTYLAITTGNNYNTYSCDNTGTTPNCDNTNTADANARIHIYSVNAAGALTETTASVANTGSKYTLGKTIRPRCIEWDTTGNYLMVGTTETGGSGSGGGGPTNLYCFSFTTTTGGATLGDIFLNATALSNQPTGGQANRADIRGLSWNPTTTDLIFVVTNTDGIIQNLQIFLFNPTGKTGSLPGSLTQQSIVGTANSHLNENAIAVDWSPDGGCLGIGKYIVPPDIGTDSDFQAFRIYSFAQTGTFYTMNASSSFTGITELEGFQWGHGGTVLATGNDTRAGAPLASINAYLARSFVPSCSIWSDLNVVLNNNLDFFNVCITFSGNSTISGQGHCLSIDPTSTIIVSSNSSLLIKDLTVLGVRSNIIQCTDQSSTLTFKNVQLDLAANYNFNLGHFDIFSDVHVVGNGLVFAYASPTQSTVQSNGRFILDHGVTFSYAPSIANGNLISLVDSTAQILLKGATLYSTMTGMMLTKGQLVVDRQSFVSSDASVLAQAVSFGDGVNAANNLTVRLLPDAQLLLTRGIIAYNNV